MSGQNQSAAPGGFLGTVERVGNKLPDPAVLFIALLFIVWVLSWILSYVTFDVVDPRSGEALVIQTVSGETIVIEGFYATDNDVVSELVPDKRRSSKHGDMFVGVDSRTGKQCDVMILKPVKKKKTKR